MNRISNDIFQRWNAPTVQIYPGQTYSAYCAGVAGCGIGPDQQVNLPAVAPGTYGYYLVNNAGTLGQAVSYNHAFFAQDAWTIGKGVTINAGIRFEHENVPAEAFGLAAGLSANPINFGWGSKIAPRVGVAWDVFRDGRDEGLRQLRCI